MRIVLAAALLSLAACNPGAENPYTPPSIPAPVTSSPSPQPSVIATRMPIVETSIGKKDQYYRNCAEAKEAGAAPLRRGVDGGYRTALDRDNDGIACD